MWVIYVVSNFIRYYASHLLCYNIVRLDRTASFLQFTTKIRQINLHQTSSGKTWNWIWCSPLHSNDFFRTYLFIIIMVIFLYQSFHCLKSLSLRPISATTTLIVLYLLIMFLLTVVMLNQSHKTRFKILLLQ